MRRTVLTVFILFPCILFSQWEQDVRLTNDGNYSGTSMTNAWCISAQGDTVHVVWYDNRDGNYEIYYKRSTDGGTTWGPDTRLTNASGESMLPSLALSDSIVHIVWRDDRDGNREIYYKRSTDRGTTWGPDTRLTNDTSISWNPSLATSGLNVHVVWFDRRDGNDEIYYKRSTDGGTTWNSDIRLTNEPIASWYAGVAVSDSFIHVAWFQGGTSNQQVYYKRSTDGGTTWGPDIQLNDNPAEAYYPSITAQNSNVHVAWQDSRNGAREIYYIRSTDNGTTWGPNTRLTFDPAQSFGPNLATWGSNVHIVWFDQRDGNEEIYYKRSTDGGTTWGPDTRLTTFSGRSWATSVAVSGTKVHVVWQDNRDGNDEIYYKRNPNGNIKVEEKEPLTDRIPEVISRVIPNPFTTFTRASEYEKKFFILYDISGRYIGIYRGDRIGKPLSSGVYFIIPMTNNLNPVRIIKLDNGM